MKMFLKRVFSFLVAAALTLGMGNFAPDMKQPVRAEEPAMGALFAMEFHGQGWGQWSPDNRRVYRTQTYPTAFRATLDHQPAGMTGTIQYQVKLTGGGWGSVWSMCHSRTRYYFGGGNSNPAIGFRLCCPAEAK